MDGSLKILQAIEKGEAIEPGQIDERCRTSLQKTADMLASRARSYYRRADLLWEHGVFGDQLAACQREGMAATVTAERIILAIGGRKKPNCGMCGGTGYTPSCDGEDVDPCDECTEFAVKRRLSNAG